MEENNFFGENKSTDDRWTCSHCGPVKPTTFYYSCPLQADCPKCFKRLHSLDGIKVLLLEEHKKKRPEWYKDEK